MFKSCEYVISAVSKKQFPNVNNLNEYVFLGRSNVGKSSFINALTNRKALAKTSSKPGKTRAINFFIIDEKMYLVDVPGYGYAAQSITTREDFGKYIEEYLKYLNITVMVVGTKCDKVGTTQLIKHKKMISNTLGLSLDKIFLTSSEKKLGFDKIIELLENE